MVSHGGIYLNALGRRTFLREYEQRLAKEFNSEHAGHRTTLRQQLRANALDLKAALIEPGRFRPFRLN
jgi:CRISPR-associated protein Cas1